MKKRSQLAVLLGVPAVLSLGLIPIARQRRQWLTAQAATSALLKETDQKQPRLAVMKHLVAQGATVNALDEAGCTPLALTTLHNDLAGSQFLISKGAQVNTRDNAGATPLLHAAFGGESSLVQLMLAHGANANDQLKDGSASTALSLAVQRNDANSVKALLAYGANPNRKQPIADFGMSSTMTVLKYLRIRPLHYRYDTNTAYGRNETRKSAQIKQLLLQAGAKE